MRKFAIFMLVPLLAACAGTDYNLTYSTSQHRNSNYTSGPQNPTSAFSDPITTSNENYTGIISNTDDQISRYITYRLNEFKNYNSNVHKNVSDLEIARAAAFLTDGELTASDIEKYFGDNTTLMHMAVYVVDNRLNRCFAGGGTDPVACFIKWRDTYKTAFNTIANEIKLHTTKMDMADAEFNAADGNKITFIVDNGKIVGATIGGTDYKNFYNKNIESADKVSFDSVTFNTGGKQVELTYSDFGIYTISRYGFDTNGDPNQFQERIADRVPFAGGYASQHIDSDKVAKDLHFRGRAIGTARDEKDMISLDGDAQLDFYTAGAKSALTANFRNWYDVVVQSDGTITFDDYFGNGKVRFGDADEYTKTGAKMNVGFYGENPASNIPTEVVGTVQFHDTDTDIKMDIAFGAK